MFIDTHLHLNEEKNNEIKKIINEAFMNKVEILILSGCTKNDNIKNIELIKKYENVYTTIGYHPSEAMNINDKDIEKLKKQIFNNKKIIGIGEIGLDYYYGKDNTEKQKEIFKKQLDLAEKLSLPVVIHTRDAFFDTYNILKEYDLSGIIHCFSGNIETANKYIELGYLLGIGGVVTFSNSKLKEVVKSLNLKNIVLETDAPYLSPKRGEKNSPSNIKLIAEYIAKIKNIDIEKIASDTSRNAIELFNLNITK